MFAKLEQMIAKKFFVSVRSILEFLVVFNIILFSDPMNSSIKIGLVMAFLGLLIRIWASAFRYNSSEFMVRGPYRFVRHPHMLGSILILLGMCLAGRNIYVSTISLLVIGTYFFFLIRSEEKEMLRLWGSRYLIFKANVSAVFPQLIPAVPAGGEDKTYTLQTALTRSRMKEISTILGVVLAFSLLYWRSLLANPMYFYLMMLFIGLFFAVFRPIYYHMVKK